MTTNKRRKVVKYRGSKTHGGGSKKKRRGSGHRGGRGMAGSRKQNKPSILKLYGNEYYGKHGFTRHGTKKVKSINVGMLNDMLPKLVAEKKAAEEKGSFVVDLGAIGYDKLLGTGNVTRKIKVTANAVSKNAEAKIASAGGLVAAKQKGEAAEEKNEPE